MAITIHLMVRYRELHFNNPETAHRKLVFDTVNLMLKPCLYAALTTIAGFGSLLLCDIKPVIHFGWMMSASSGLKWMNWEKYMARCMPI